MAIVLDSLVRVVPPASRPDTGGLERNRNAKMPEALDFKFMSISDTFERKTPSPKGGRLSRLAASSGLLGGFGGSAGRGRGGAGLGDGRLVFDGLGPLGG